MTGEILNLGFAVIASVFLGFFKEELKGFFTAWSVHRSVCKHYLDKKGRLSRKGMPTKPTRIQILSSNEQGGVSWGTVEIVDSAMSWRKDDRGVLIDDILSENKKRRRVVKFKNFDLAVKAEVDRVE